MARHRGKDSKPNAVLGDFIKNYNQDHKDAVDVGADQPAMGHWLRDALGHHASQYAAANKAGNSKMANEHASRYTKILRLMDKMERAHALDTPLHFDAVPYQAWQRHGADRQFSDSKKSSGFDLPGWKNHDQNDKKKDYSWMQNPAHKDHKDTAGHVAAGNGGHYPMEATKVNSRYIPIDPNAEPSGTVVAHPLDSHPIWNYLDKPSTTLSDSDVADYNKRLAEFNASPEHEKLNDKLETLMHPQHGSARGPSVHGENPAAASPEVVPVERRQVPAVQSQAQPAKAVIRRPAAEATAKEEPKIDASNIPAHLRHLIG